jgi:WD40 repeat protein
MTSDRRYLVSASDDGFLRLWLVPQRATVGGTDAPLHEIAAFFLSTKINSVDFFPPLADGSSSASSPPAHRGGADDGVVQLPLVLTASDNGSVDVWRLVVRPSTTGEGKDEEAGCSQYSLLGEPVHVTSLRGHTSWVASAAVIGYVDVGQPAGRGLRASAYNSTEADDTPVRSGVLAAHSSDGGDGVPVQRDVRVRIASGGGDKTVCVWDWNMVSHVVMAPTFVIRGHSNWVLKVLPLPPLPTSTL